MEFFLPALMEIGRPPRGPGEQAALTLNAQSINASFAWGSSPGSATIVYIGDTGITRGAKVALTLGANFLVGLCQSDVANVSSGGNTRTLQFVDFREYLTWDFTFCSFNRSVRRCRSDGRRLKQYRHVYPVDADRMIETYTNAPLVAWEMIEAILMARVTGLSGGFPGGTIGTPWTWDFTSGGEFPAGVLNMPIYDFDALGGRRLDAAINEICGRAGVVFTLASTPTNIYHLVFTRKGAGVLPTFAVGGATTPAVPTATSALPIFPSASEDRHYGEKLSTHPTNIRILGERNLYQLMDVPLVADWARAWEDFFQVELLAEWLFANATDGRTPATRYNAIPGDIEHFIGRHKAMERALRISVREMAALTGNAGLADYRLFAGRSRMDMPAALYVQTLLFRAFRPDLVSLTTWDGRPINLEFVNLSDRQLCRVSHHLLTGAMTAYPADPTDGNGYAIHKGFSADDEFLRQIKPGEFDPTLLAEASPERLWHCASFQIDSSGEGTRFVIFDQPVITMDPAHPLLVKVDGYWMMNAGARLAVPVVKASLTFEAERFSQWFRNSTVPDISRDGVENVPALRRECVGFLVNGSWSYTEIPYEDGRLALEKARDIATGLLDLQQVYAEGGYKSVWKPTQKAATFGARLTSMIDRVQTSSGATGGTVQVVDFTSERERDHFEPERDLERRSEQASLFPGQRELRDQADQYEKVAEFFKQQPRSFVNFLVRYLRGETQPGQVTGVVWFKPRAGGIPAGAVVPVGTPLRGAKTSLATYPLDVVPGTDNLFLGATTRANQPADHSLPLQTTGQGYVRVLGPVRKNDAVGLASTATDWLVKGGTPSVGTVQADNLSATGNPAVDVKLLPIIYGAAGASAGMYRLKSVQGDYVTCRTWDGTVEGTADVYIAMQAKIRHSILQETIEGVTYFYTYPVVGVGALATDGTFLSRFRVAHTGSATGPVFETCVVTPEWLPDDVIWAVAATTGVYRTPGPPPTDPVGLLMAYDGREWALHA